MPRPRSVMRKIKEVLRLAFGEGLSRRQVSRATALLYTTRLRGSFIRIRAVSPWWTCAKQAARSQQAAVRSAEAMNHCERAWTGLP